MITMIYCLAPSAIASEIINDTAKNVVHKKYKNAGDKLRPHVVDMEKLPTFKPFNLGFGNIDFSQWKVAIVLHQTKRTHK